MFRIFRTEKAPISLPLLADIKEEQAIVESKEEKAHPVTYQDVPTVLKYISASYLLNLDENTPAPPTNLVTITSVDPEMLDITYPGRDARYQDTWKYTRKACHFYLKCTNDDDCGGITHIVCAPLCAPVCCTGLFADGINALKRQHNLSRDNENLQNIFGPAVQRMN